MTKFTPMTHRKIKKLNMPRTKLSHFYPKIGSGPQTPTFFPHRPSDAKKRDFLAKKWDLWPHFFTKKPRFFCVARPVGKKVGGSATTTPKMAIFGSKIMIFLGPWFLSKIQHQTEKFGKTRFLLKIGLKLRSSVGRLKKVPVCDPMRAKS